MGSFLSVVRRDNRRDPHIRVAPVTPEITPSPPRAFPRPPREKKLRAERPQKAKATKPGRSFALPLNIWLLDFGNF